MIRFIIGLVLVLVNFIPALIFEDLVMSGIGIVTGLLLMVYGNKAYQRSKKQKAWQARRDYLKSRGQDV